MSACVCACVGGCTFVQCYSLLSSSAILSALQQCYSPLSSSAALQQCYSPLSSSANLRAPAVLISALQQCYSLLSSSAILCSPADSLCSCHMWFWMSDCSLLMCIFSNIHQSGVLTVLSGCCMAGAMWNYCCLGSLSVYTIQPCTSSQCHFTQSHLGRMHVCLAATSHLHFWQNDRDFLCAYVIVVHVVWRQVIHRHPFLRGNGLYESIFRVSGYKYLKN